MEFDQVLALRKSIRSYTDEPVSKEDLAALVKAALASSVGKHNDAGYTLCVVTDPVLLSAIDKEAEEKLGKHHMFFEAPALIFICETKEAFDYLKEFDAGIIAEHIHLKASVFRKAPIRFLLSRSVTAARQKWSEKGIANLRSSIANLLPHMLKTTKNKKALDTASK